MKLKNTDRFFGYTIAAVVQDILNYKKSGSVLDLGSGTGRHALYLADQGFEVTAMDNDEDKLSELKQNAKRLRLKIKTKKADLSEIKIKKKYDIVLANMSLHFLRRNQIDQAIAEIRNCTNPGGLNAIGVLTDKNPKGYRPYLFKGQELKKYYTDWKVLKYEERLSKSYVRMENGKQERQHIALIIAKKVR